MIEKLQRSILILSLSLVPLLSACSKTETASGDLESTAPDNPGDGIVNDAGGFYVRVVPQPLVTASIHAFNDFAASCTIDTAASATDLLCMVNIREQDLYFWGLTFEINIPRAMCKYLVELPYYYYNRMGGTGPRSIEVTTNAAGALTTCDIDNVPGTIAGGAYCTFPNGDGWTDGGGQPHCLYDYSPDGPNCCTGDYTSVITTPDGTTSSSGRYGGAFGSCLSGPATDTEIWKVSKSGWPQRMHYSIAESGFNRTFKAKSPISVWAGGFNVYVSNFFGWTGYTTSNAAWLALTRPEAFVPGTDFGGNNIPSAHESYEYMCLDESAEVKHRIRVYVNEWDTNEKFAAYHTGSGATANSPNAATTDQDGVHCDVGGSVTGWCDDYEDWDRNMTTYPNEVLQ